MSKKSIVCVKGTPKPVDTQLLSPITTNANQIVKLSTREVNSLSFDKTQLSFNKNKNSDTFTVTGKEAGTFSIRYYVTGDYTNEALSSLISFIVVDPLTAQNGFYNIDGCTSVFFVRNGQTFTDGNVVGYYTANGTATTVRVDSSNIAGYSLEVTDPQGNVTVHSGSSITINIPNGSVGLWTFVPSADLFIDMDGGNLATPSTWLTMFENGNEINTILVFQQGISYFHVNDCFVPGESTPAPG